MSQYVFQACQILDHDPTVTKTRWPIFRECLLCHAVPLPYPFPRRASPPHVELVLGLYTLTKGACISTD
eukprot:11388385-Karenia_brevis.AAC.1